MAITDKKQHWLDVIFRDKVLLPGTDGVIVPSGTTAERPPTPDNGLIRYNLTDARLEAYENGLWGVIGASAGGGVAFYTDLLDTDSSYVGLGNNILRVNAGETGVETVNGATLFIPLTGGVSVSGDVTFTSGATIKGLPLTPLGNQDAASKAYVDSVSAGLDPKESCRAATTINLPSYTPVGGSSSNGAFTSVNLTGPLTDGISMNVGDRLLVKDQSNPFENGIYVVLTGGPGGSMERAPDHDNVGNPNEVTGGNYTFVEAGSQSGTGWVILFDGSIILNTHAINWSQFSGAGSASLAGLTDTIITAPAIGDLLQFNGASWVNVGSISRIQNTSSSVFVDTDLVTDQLDLKAGDNAAGAGGALLMNAGNATVAGAGGAITVTTGIGTSGNSGILTLRGANAVTTGIGGDVSVIAGTSSGDRRGGAVAITAGNTPGNAVDGGAITITSGSSTANGYGGSINLSGGVGTGGANEGGSITLTPGTGPVNGSVDIYPVTGAISTELRFYEGTFNGNNWLGLKSPDAVTTTTTWELPDGDGTPLQFLQTNGAGSLQWATISLSTPSAIQDGDADTFVSTDFGGGDSDNLRIQTGSTNPFGNGGLLEIITGAGGATGGTGGDMQVTLGTGGAASNGGNFTLYGGPGTTSGNGGNIIVRSGLGGIGGGAAPGGNGGLLDLIAADAGGSSFGNAGNAQTVRLLGGSGGNTTAGPGNGGAGSDIQITSGMGGSSNSATAGKGGDITVRALHSTGDGLPGNLRMYSGNGATNGGGGGEIFLQSGNAPFVGGSHSAGPIRIYAGVSASNADGADVKIHAGDGNSLATTNQRGGNVTIKAGDGTVTNGAGGKIVLDIGSPQGVGDRGHVEVTDDGNGVNGGELRLLEGDGGGDYVGFKAPTSVTASEAWQLPPADGTVNQFMVTNGSGILFFVDQPYDVGSSLIGAPLTTGTLWRFSTVRPFTFHASAAGSSISSAFADPATLATAVSVFEIHLVGPSTGPALIPGVPSPTNIGTVTFGIGAAFGAIATWVPGAGPLPPPGAPVVVPPAHEILLHYPVADVTLGNISFTFDGVI